jgi:ATP-dependent exoDNAse (exonuclease V) beta subunit
MSFDDLTRTRLEKPTDQRYLGTEIHRLIEERSFESAEGEDPGSFFTTFPDETELDEPAEPEERAALEAKLLHWDALGYGDRELARLPSGQPMVELPFAFRRDGAIIRGRIDAVFETEDGGLEIVDWKSGQRFEVEGPDQLGIYAEALEAIGLVPEGAEVRLTYAFLDGKPPLSRTWERSAVG